jgi:DNA-binding MarR family transcriptional regulator
MKTPDDFLDPMHCSYEVLKQFRLIFKAVQQHSQSVESECGLSSAQLWALWELLNRPGMKVTELANVMSIHHSTASNLLDKLAKKNLIVRERISEDQRVVTLQLTETGRNLLEKTKQSPQGILQQTLFGLPNDVLIALASNLDALISEMGIKDQDAAMEPINPIPGKSKMR